MATFPRNLAAEPEKESNPGLGRGRIRGSAGPSPDEYVSILTSIWGSPGRIAGASMGVGVDVTIHYHCEEISSWPGHARMISKNRILDRLHQIKYKIFFFYPG